MIVTLLLFLFYTTALALPHPCHRYKHPAIVAECYKVNHNRPRTALALPPPELLACHRYEDPALVSECYENIIKTRPRTMLQNISLYYIESPAKEELYILPSLVPVTPSKTYCLLCHRQYGNNPPLDSGCYKQCQTPKQSIQERRLPAPSHPFSAADLCFIRRWAPSKVRECYKKVTGQELTDYRRLQTPYQDSQSRFLYPFGPYVVSPLALHGLYGLGVANLLFQPFHETVDQLNPMAEKV